MKSPVQIGGLWCEEVLARLLDYRDGALDAGDAAAVEEHLTGCGRCAEFGGAYAAVVEAVRRRRVESPALDRGVAERLRQRLDREARPS